MLPALLITFREVIEASLIVATILGILFKLKQNKGIKTVWAATISAAFVSLLLLATASVLGFKIHNFYTGKIEQYSEGILMIISSVFITWSVFFLHKYFAHNKTLLLQKIKSIVEKREQKGLFILVFTAVFREGFEIFLFLSTIYLSANPQAIFTGFITGSLSALVISFALFSATIKMPIFYAFRTTSMLLIFFAAGLLTRGIHEFAEAGLIPEIGKVTFHFIPEKTSFGGEIIKVIFGITQKMDFVQLSFYSIYIFLMVYWVFLRKKGSKVILK